MSTPDRFASRRTRLADSSRPNGRSSIAGSSWRSRFRKVRARSLRGRRPWISSVPSTSISRRSSCPGGRRRSVATAALPAARASRGRHGQRSRHPRRRAARHRAATRPHGCAATSRARAASAIPIRSPSHSPAPSSSAVGGYARTSPRPLESPSPSRLVDPPCVTPVSRTRCRVVSVVPGRACAILPAARRRSRPLMCVP